MNIENINKLIHHLKSLKNEENFSMNQWLRFGWFGDSEVDWDDEPASRLVEQMHEKGDCGTVACIAGHAAILKAAEEGDTSGKYDIYSARDQAENWLGLTEQQADVLFEPRSIAEFMIEFSREEAIQALEYMRDHGEVRWPKRVSRAGGHGRFVDIPPIPNKMV